MIFVICSEYNQINLRKSVVCGRLDPSYGPTVVDIIAAGNSIPNLIRSRPRPGHGSPPTREISISPERIHACQIRQLMGAMLKNNAKSSQTQCGHARGRTPYRFLKLIMIGTIARRIKSPQASKDARLLLGLQRFVSSAASEELTVEVRIDGPK